MGASELFGAMERAIVDGNEPVAIELARRALQEGVAPLDAIEKGFLPGIQRAGELWEEGEFFLPELVGAAQTMKKAMDVLRPALEGESRAASTGRVVIGTVKGDIHDIGKTLVASMLAANGFVVADEGTDVSVERFVEKAREIDADLVCASALLTTTMNVQRELVAAVRKSGLKSRVMVGGAPVTRGWADEIGADGYADNAVAAVDVAKGLVRR